MPFMRTGVFNQILSLAALKDGELHPCGTAFLIGNKIAFAATHVLDQPFDQRNFNYSIDINNSTYSIVAIQTIDGNESTIQWQVLKVFRMPSLSQLHERPIDICIIELSEHPDLTDEHATYGKRYFQINVAPPIIGEEVTAYGFAYSKIKQSIEEPNLFDLTHAFKKITGKVQNIFSPMRDEAGIPFPAFEIDADYEEGMSGGPIFNNKDQVCGVISRSGLSGISYGSIIWPAMGIKLDNKFLIDLARSREIIAINHQCVHLDAIEESEFPNIHFNPSIMIS